MALVEWRGLACDDPDGVFLEVTRGFRMPAAVRGVDYIIAAAPGRLGGDREADVLALALEGYVVGDDSEDWAANRDALIATFVEAGADPGTLTVRAPLYGLSSGESCSIDCRVVNVAEGPITAYERQTFSIALESISGSGWVLTTGGS